MITDDLEVVLARYPAIARPCGTPEPLGNAGGGSGARLWRFPSGRGILVARAWPPEGPGRATLEKIHEWLAGAASLGFVPVPLAALDGRTVQERGDRLWEVAPWLRGTSAQTLPVPPARVRAGFAALAALHQCLARERAIGLSHGLRERVGETEMLAGGSFRELARCLARSTDHGSKLARTWIALAEQTAPRVLPRLKRDASREVLLQPCLRDARPEHFLFEEDRVTGLVDFGAMGIDTVAADLARLLTEWVECDRQARADALAAYAAVRSLDQSETLLIDAFEASAALLGAGRWVRWHFIEGRPFDDPSAVVRGLERGLSRLQRLIANDAG